MKLRKRLLRIFLAPFVIILLVFFLGLLVFLTFCLSGTIVKKLEKARGREANLKGKRAFKEKLRLLGMLVMLVGIALSLIWIGLTIKRGAYLLTSIFVYTLSCFSYMLFELWRLGKLGKRRHRA